MVSTIGKWLIAVVTGLALLVGVASARAQPAPGPGSWSSSQTWAADSVNGGSLTGYFYWPATTPAGKRALVLVLHGCLQTAAGDVIDKAADKGFNWKAMGDRYGAVILAPNATGNVYGNHCWDYANTDHKRNTGHDGILLDLIARFVGNPQYAIDPHQIYVAGLSSGGGEAMALACLAPDIFAGVGINAGPPPGTTTAQISAVPSGYSAATAANRCKTLAGGNADQFATQIASVIWGSADFTVAQGYGPIDAAAMRGVYGGGFNAGAPLAVPNGGSNISYTDSKGKARTAEMTVSGMGHAWPAGSGGQNSHFVDATKVDYPAFVMDFWYKNNLRVNPVAAPVVTACGALVAGGGVTVSGAGSDPVGAIDSYRVRLTGPSKVDDGLAGSGASFSKTYAQLANGYYTGAVTASDSATGLESAPCLIAQFLIGPAPALAPPTGLAARAASANSIALGWNAVDGAGGYNLYRDGVKVNPAALNATVYTDNGLLPSTHYSYQVSALAASGESALSGAVAAATTSAFTCTSTYASNYAHVRAGRAHDSGGLALANGSNQNMGLDNLFFSANLAQTAPGYYVIGACPH